MMSSVAANWPASRLGTTVAANDQRISYVRLFAFPAIIFLFRFAPLPFAGDVAYGLTAIYALTGRRQAGVAMLVLCLLNMATHAFVPPPGLAAIYRHFVVMVIAFSAVLLHRSSVPQTRSPVALMVGTASICGLLFAHALLFSTNTAISVLKTASFSMAILGQFAAWAGLTPQQRRIGEIQVWGLLAGVTILSVPLLATPLGYLREEFGFKGIIVHSQSFGLLMGVFAAYLWMTVFSRKKLSVAIVLLSCLVTAFVFLSRARVGALGMTLGVFSGLMLSPVTAVLDRLRARPRVMPHRLAWVLLLSIVAVLGTGGLVSKAVAKFVDKYDRTEANSMSYWEALYGARSHMVHLMMESVRRRPTTGIGFGVPTEGGRSQQVVNDPIFGLPIMATVEKGVMPVAVLEELGYPLATVIYVYLAGLLILAARAGPVMLAVYTAAMAINLGESVFFSPGGMGSFVLVMVGMAVTAAPYASHCSAKQLPAGRYLPLEISGQRFSDARSGCS